jgi:hypothetical protein
MHRCLLLALLLALAVPYTPSAGEGRFKRIFDGRTLKGWSSPDLTYWSVEDGTLTARSTEAHPCTKNQFLVWQGGEIGDFELKLKFRIQGEKSANSGIQIRSKIQPDGHAEGYQADIDRAGQYAGALYDEHTSRGMLAERGQRTVIDEEGRRATESIADPAELFKRVNLDGWNEYHILARGNRITLKINGRTTAEVIDRQKDESDASGRLALQLHSGPPMTVQFRDIRLKTR